MAIGSRTLYEIVYLTPFQAGVVNLILIGIPFYFGLLPTGILSHDWFHRPASVVGQRLGFVVDVLDSASQPCSLFAVQNNEDANSNLCKNNTELRAVNDMGQAFLLQYGLSWVILLVLWARPQRRWIDAILYFHRLLLGYTLVSLLLLAFFQKTHPHILTSPPLDTWIPIIPPPNLWSSNFFSNFVFLPCHGSFA